MTWRAPVAFCLALAACGPGGPQAPRGERFADLRLPGLRGDVQPLRADDGRVAVVNFWATWCAPCRVEMPALDCLHRAGAAQLQVVGVSVDHDPRVAEEYLADRRIAFPSRIDPGGVQSRAVLQVRALPTTLVVAPDGTVLERIEGVVDWADGRRLAAWGLPPEGAGRSIAAACSRERSS